MKPHTVLILTVLLQYQGAVHSSALSEAGQRVQYWFRQASVYRSLGEFEKSFVAVQKAFRFSQQAPRKGYEGKCLVRMGILKWDLGEIEDSEGYFSQAKAIFEKSYDRRSQEFCESCLSLIQRYQEGKKARLAHLYFLSIELFERAWLLGRDIGIEDFALKCLRQQAMTYLEMRRLDLFLENSKKGLVISKRLNHRIEQARCSNNIGVYYQQKASYSQAVGHFENALLVLRRDQDPTTEAEILNNLGLAYRELGNLNRAHFFLSQALALDKKTGDARSICLGLENLGSVYLRRGIENRSKDDLLQALAAFQEGLSLLGRRGVDPRISFAALNNIGIIYIELKDHESARRYLRLALASIEREGAVLERCQALNNIASSFLAERNIDEALKHYLRSFEVCSKQSYDNILMECCLGLGRCYETRQDDSTALFFYRKSIEALENMRARMPAEPFSIGFARNKFDAYEKAIHILAARYDKQASEGILVELFDLIERAKARAFLENVREALSAINAADRSVLRERQLAISKNIQELSSKIAGRAVSGQEMQALANELDVEEDEYIRLMSEMRLQSDDEEARWRRSIRSLQDIQGMLLSEDSVMLEYFLGEPRSYLLRISAETVRLYGLPSKADIEASLRAYLRFISDFSLDPQAGSGPAERIGKELMPLDRDVIFMDAKNLLVIPDGVLHKLPFEALRISAAQGSIYLIEKIPVSYCPSASSLMLLRNSMRLERWKKDLLAIGEPAGPSSGFRHGDGPAIVENTPERAGIPGLSLPYSGEEVQDIAKQFPSHRVDILTGAAANETELKKLALEDYRIIHFACHGWLDERYPARSALVLSLVDGSDEDGLLQAREIYGLTLNAQMVVLSACQTARGPLETSEGSMALSRPFFFAGASSLIASLWPISDKATVILMHEFYRNLVQGRSKSESLRSAKMRLLRSSWDHPYYWASFMLLGDPSALGPAR